ncbi:MAG: hypothetical protein LBL52_01635 [Rickettsiales bacterium]|jgi:hypothetical protein|nr:hypothetical protein [Rickettsiales bacterium]
MISGNASMSAGGCTSQVAVFDREVGYNLLADGITIDTNNPVFSGTTWGVYSPADCSADTLQTPGWSKEDITAQSFGSYIYKLQ